MSNLTRAWNVCTNTLTSNSKLSKDYEHSLEALHQDGLTRTLGIWAVRNQEQTVRNKVAIPLSEISPIHSSEEKILRIISNAHAHFVRARNYVASLEELPSCAGCTRRFLLRTSAILDNSLPPQFSTLIYRILNRGLCDFEDNKASLHIFQTLCSQLIELGFSRIVEEAVCWVVFQRIDRLVSENTEGKLNNRALPDLLKWMQHFVDKWISSVLPLPSGVEETVPLEEVNDQMMIAVDNARIQQMKLWRKRLSFHLHETVGTIRTSQLLQLVELFPASLPALEDLRDCILSTDQKPIVTKSLRDQFSESMLKAGTLTSDILQQYVNMIRTLRFLDPSGVILENVSDPVREYLRRRPDTVRCIVSGMTGDGDLYEELERGLSKRRKDGDGDVDMDSGENNMNGNVGYLEDEDCLSIDGDFGADMDVDPGVYIRWEPEPIDAPRRDGKWRSGGDAIATLVTIYGSSEQIVNEYKGLLADKLVSSFDLDLERECRILQLLTERFGKEAMHACSIMLNDVKDSRATLAVAQSEQKDVDRALSKFDATIISKEFWPKMVGEAGFRATGELEKQMELFGTTFAELKLPRKLVWQYGLGVISVTLTFEDGREVEATVSPIQATILSHFADQKQQNVKELQEKMEVEDTSLFQRKIQGLANQGLIRNVDSSNTVYETVEQGGDLEYKGGLIEDERGDLDDGDNADQRAEDAEMAVYESYIMAMLQNLKQLPLEQIHSMLQRFVQTPVYDKTQAQLASFVGQLVDKGKVEVSAGMYRVAK